MSEEHERSNIIFEIAIVSLIIPSFCCRYFYSNLQYFFGNEWGWREMDIFLKIFTHFNMQWCSFFFYYISLSLEIYTFFASILSPSCAIVQKCLKNIWREMRRTTKRNLVNFSDFLHLKHGKKPTTISFTFPSCMDHNAQIMIRILFV